MKSKKTRIALRAMLLTAILVMAMAVTSFAREIPKNMRANLSYYSYLDLKLDEGETIGKITVNKKGALTVKKYGTYKHVSASYPEDNENSVEYGILAKKAGTYKLNIQIKKGKKVVKKATVKVYVTNGTPFKSIKFAGKQYAATYNKSLGSYVSRYKTTKSKGKLKVTMNKGYK